MPWLLLKLKNLKLVWIGLTLLMLSGCSSSHPSKTDQVEFFFCDPEPAWTETGEPDVENVRVDKTCLRGLTKRVKACYKPQ